MNKTLKETYNQSPMYFQNMTIASYSLRDNFNTINDGIWLL